jgi:ParB-like chromosome segregation protein Spo0J
MSYALDLHSPVRHVATELERADHALSVSELASTYTHPNHGDVNRVKKFEHLRSDRAAVEWIIERALEKISKYLDNGDGTYQLAVPFDDIKLNRRKLQRVLPRERFEGYFDPMMGTVAASDGEPVEGFAKNIRDMKHFRETGESAEDLRESLQAFGWIPELPGLQDERGVILIGNRRLAIATELGIDPVMKTVQIGHGDEADARRLKITIASNIGQKTLTSSDRKRIARALYADYDWSMPKIAEALQVGTSTVGRDVKGISQRGKRKKPQGRPRNITRRQEEEIVAPALEQRKGRPAIAKLLEEDDGQKRGEHAVQLAIERVRTREEEQDRRDNGTRAAGKHTSVCSTCGREDIHEG